MGRLVAFALLTGCARAAPAPALFNRELRLEPPAARVCESLLVRPAMLCIGDAILYFDGCRWRCHVLDRQW